MNSQDISNIFSALAHPSRIEILMALLKATEIGVPMGKLSDALEIPASTLKHHLVEMEHSGVVQRRHEGRKSVFTVDTAKLNEVIFLLKDICCPPDIVENSKSEEIL